MAARVLSDAESNGRMRGTAQSPRPKAGRSVALLVVTLLASCGGSIEQTDVPPAGTIWFGSTFDPETFELAGRTDTVSTTETFALVGTLPSTIDASELGIRASWNGQSIYNEAANASGSGDVWGFTYGPLFEAGTWTIEFTDIGGNVLASGTVTAAD